jgi:hypothetical protein
MQKYGYRKPLQAIIAVFLKLMHPYREGHEVPSHAVGMLRVVFLDKGKCILPSHRAKAMEWIIYQQKNRTRNRRHPPLALHQYLRG